MANYSVELGILMKSPLKKDRRGVVALEYALISAMCAVTLIASLEPLGVSMGHVFQDLNSTLSAAISSAELNQHRF